ncbi:PREDICTED: cytochrome P450 4C1-like isoform X2 [Dinoponera quadriceps]|uniref:Cytochrome P450 4C1-like isoform X2 n=1 Tax=Dinoponera quadriceps TaxID=609295 RepID=A0A6P3XVH4_DINQU|nr:PREDICTED: cytochrome P450 4C1-like isoform X2 [Dinoponera quadriceps]
MFLSAVLIILICIGMNYLISNYRKQLPLIRAANLLPGPKTKPIIGNAYYFLQRNFDEYLQSICLLTDIYPSPFRLWFGNNLLIFVTEPDHVKTILQSPSCLNKSMMYNHFKAWLGMGVFTAPAPIWVEHRKMIASSFNTNILRVFLDTFVEQASILMDKLEHMVGEEVDLFHYIAMCTLDIISGTSLGIKLESQSNQNDQYVKALERLKEIIFQRTRNIFLFPDIIFHLTSLNREQQKHLNFIHSTTEQVIRQKEEARNNPDTTKTECAKPPRRVFLDVLMEASNKGKKFTRKNIHDEINTMCAAGTDTTAVTMNFTIFMLANHPEIQEKVYEELLKIYGTQDPKSAPVKFEDLQHMNYLERVIKETLRLFPVAPLIGRRLTEDLTIEKNMFQEDILCRKAPTL